MLNSPTFSFIPDVNDEGKWRINEKKTLNRMVMLDNHTAKFQLMVPVLSHDVTENLTGHMMHLEGPQIYQIKC